MSRKILRSPQPGIAHAVPFFGISRRTGDDEEVVCPVRGSHLAHFAELFEDFLGDYAVSSDPGGVYDASPAGSPTTGIVANAANGQFQLKLSATNEAQLIGWTPGSRNIPANSRWWAMFRVQIVTMPSTNERILIGLFSDITDIVDDIARNVCVRLEASSSVLLETDDGTTDDDDNDSGHDLTEDTWYWLLIDAYDDSAIRFYLADANLTGARKLGELAASAMDSTTLQPAVLVQKDSGTGVPEALVDTVFARWER